MRTLKPGGILFITLHGNVFAEKLSEAEKERFNNGIPVNKAKTKEGHRIFAAFQPTGFVQKLTGDNTIVEHIPGQATQRNVEQDVWIIKKSENK